ncbi:MAG: acyl carrier protein [Burkholderiales bacterium]
MTTPSLTTADRIRALIAKDFNIPPERLSEDARLEELGVDSIGMAEVIFNLEDALELQLPEPVEPLATFGDVVRYVERVMAEQAPKSAISEPISPPA